MIRALPSPDQLSTNKLKDKTGITAQFADKILGSGIGAGAAPKTFSKKPSVDNLGALKKAATAATGKGAGGSTAHDGAQVAASAVGDVAGSLMSCLF